MVFGDRVSLAFFSVALLILVILAPLLSRAAVRRLLQRPVSAQRANAGRSNPGSNGVRLSIRGSRP